ncbi:MAG: helix-turn-helix domain-containing protein [Gemmatimonadota bacterium]
MSRKRPARQVRETAQRPYLRTRIDAARRAFGSDAELAEGLGVARSQLTRWKAGQEPDAENAARLAGIDAVVELLTGYLSPKSISKWLNSPNAHLSDRRPIALLRAGRLSEVIAAIEAEKGGAFA